MGVLRGLLLPCSSQHISTQACASGPGARCAFPAELGSLFPPGLPISHLCCHRAVLWPLLFVSLPPAHLLLPTFPLSFLLIIFSLFPHLLPSFSNVLFYFSCFLYIILTLFLFLIPSPFPFISLSSFPSSPRTPTSQSSPRPRACSFQSPPLFPSPRSLGQRVASWKGVFFRTTPLLSSREPLAWERESGPWGEQGYPQM